MPNSFPTGTVTFLFTDIQGSTPLWEHASEEMAEALQVHNTALRQAIEGNGGVVIKTVGDAFQAAFSTAPQALKAAIEGQRSLQSAPWNELGELKVRMGLHTGEAELDPDGDEYIVSHTKNRVARIMSAAYGGQILLSEETADLVKRVLPEGVTLKDMGEHRLKGMEWLEHLYQVCAPGLLQDFPPLASSIRQLNNLPLQLTSFIGREKEIAEIVELLSKSRLVTLTGSGGTGKTRLSLQVAANELENYPNGAWLVELASLADPALVETAVASALRLPELPGVSITDSLVNFLRQKRLLLILDNCEHLLDACANLADKLLHACPELTVLASSREILGVSGEAPFRVPPMSLPDTRHLPTLDKLPGFDAVRLFVERARVASPNFVITETNLAGVAQVVSRLDGIPLAIELAAARLRLLSVEQVAQRLDDAFRLLTGGSRTALPRHQTLRALIDWSYNLLSPAERLALLRLSVFAGSWTLEAAEAVCSDAPLENDKYNPSSIQRDEILDLLAELVDKSLVYPTSGESGITRYRMLETIRQYAHEKLVESGEADAVRDQHLDYYVELAEQAEPHLRGMGQIQWLNLLEEELGNLRLAVEWSLPRQVEGGLRLLSDLLWFWHIHSHVPEPTEWLEKLLALESSQRGNQPPDRQRSLVLARSVAAFASLGIWHFYSMSSEAMLELQKENVRRMREMVDPPPRELGLALDGFHNRDSLLTDEQRVTIEEECQALFKQAGDDFNYIRTLGVLADIDHRSGKLTSYKEKYERCLAIAREIGDVDEAGYDLEQLADYWIEQGDLDQAEKLLLESIDCHRQTKNDWLLTLAYLTLESITSGRGEASLATRQMETAPSFFNQRADKYGAVMLLIDGAKDDWVKGDEIKAASQRQKIEAILEADAQAIQTTFVKATYQFLIGRMALSRSDWASARRHLTEALSLFGEKNRQEVDAVLDTLAVLACAQGQAERAARLFGAVTERYSMFERLLSPTERCFHAEGLVTAKQALGEAAFQTAWEEGKAMTLEQAVAYALEENDG